MNDALVANEDDEPPWLDQWKAQGFSWRRLDKHAPWQPEVGGTLQDYLRRFEGGGASDESLQADGILVECGSAGLYHILFVPPEWARSKRSIKFTPEELQEKQAGYWTKLFSNRLAPEQFRGTVSGVHLPSTIAQQLVAGYQSLVRLEFL